MFSFSLGYLCVSIVSLRTAAQKGHRALLFFNACFNFVFALFFIFASEIFVFSYVIFFLLIAIFVFVFNFCFGFLFSTGYKT